jgi:hypothetical protein
MEPDAISLHLLRIAALAAAENFLQAGIDASESILLLFWRKCEMPFQLNSVLNTVRQTLPGLRRDAVPEAQHADAPSFPLSSSSEMVNRSYRLFLDAAREVGSGESSYTYEALRRLHEASRTFEITFKEAAQRNPQTTIGNLDAAVENARARLPVQPGRNRAVLMPLLREVRTQLTPYMNLPAGTAEISNDFPALHATVTAYLEALGAQSLHPAKGLAGWLPALRLKLLTHEDLHEQALRSLQPNLFMAGRRQVQSLYARPPIDEGDELPDYSDQRRPHDLPRDLEVRIERAIRKLKKPIGTAALSDPAPFDVVNDLKFLLGSGDISAAERGEILSMLAKNIPTELQMGGTQKAKLARLFLRFLAPDQLTGKYRQTPAAVRAGVGTPRFNPDALVPHTALESIALILIREIRHFRREGAVVCKVLKAALDRSREIDPLTHVRFLRRALIQIQHSQPSILSNRILLRDLVSVVVDEIVWLKNQVAASPFLLANYADVRNAMRQELRFDPREINYGLADLSVSSAPG